jgi:regulator of replication initiation timing
MEHMDKVFGNIEGIFDKPKNKKKKSKYDYKQIENKELKKIIKDLVKDIEFLKKENVDLNIRLDELTDPSKSK